MKKLLPSILALSLVVSTLSPSYALWPFGKKDKEDETTKVEDIKQDEQQAAELEAQKRAFEEQQKKAAQKPPPPRVQIKSPLADELKGLKVEDPIESLQLPPEKQYVAVDDPSNPLGISQSASKLNRAASYISSQQYAEARRILEPLREWLINATEVHVNLHKTLKGLPTAQVQAELEKQLALQFALLRDKTFFQLGMLSVGEEDYNEAIKNLARVVQSQPRSPMGVQAYEVLQKIGFTEKIQLRGESPKPKRTEEAPAS